MKRIIFRVAALCVCALLSACAVPAKSVKLDANARQIESVSILMTIAGLEKAGTIFTPEELAAFRNDYPDVLREWVPETFNANGVPVPAMKVSAGAAGSLEQGKASHMLVIHMTAATWTSRGGQRVYSLPAYAVFEAELFDTGSGRVVWKAQPRLLVDTALAKSNSLEFARSLLRALNKDGLISLKGGKVVDEHGNAI